MNDCEGGQCVWHHEPGDGGKGVRMDVCLFHQAEDLWEENCRLLGLWREVIRLCSQEGCDGEPWDTFQALAVKALGD